ncbi:MAG: amino acid ABC transporter substrate-binding protein [Hydrogenophaga sp.]|nr:amino acid ABC transporter substrate-binding protein [Hydrogenophaga sp.]
MGATVASAATLDDVKAKGFVQCGVSTGLAGFSAPNDAGDWSGLDVDLCRGVAAAVFGDAKAVKYSPLSAKERFTALQSGEIDLLSRNTTWTMSRDTQLGLNFAGVNYYDGQGFMVRKSLGVNSALQLSGASVCVQTGTTTELNLTDYSRANKLNIKPVVFEKLEAALAAYSAGRCQAYTTDASGLASSRAKDMAKPDDHVILPELISKEPLGPAVRRGDDEWAAIVRWVGFALLEAEEYEVTQANVDQMKASSTNPGVMRLLGAGTEDTGKLLGLDKEWAYRAIKATGNYGEIFERHVGPKTDIGLPRGVNNLWSKGGVMYAPPVR